MDWLVKIFEVTAWPIVVIVGMTLFRNDLSRLFKRLF
jgi:hypothetical protein